MPARFSDIKRALEFFGILVELPKGGGSHYKATKDGIMIPIPAHNGFKSEIGDEYIRSVCRKFNIDLQAFKAKL